MTEKAKWIKVAELQGSKNYDTEFMEYLDCELENLNDDHLADLIEAFNDLEIEIFDYIRGKYTEHKINPGKYVT